MVGWKNIKDADFKHFNLAGCRTDWVHPHQYFRLIDTSLFYVRHEYGVMFNESITDLNKYHPDTYRLNMVPSTQSLTSTSEDDRTIFLAIYELSDHFKSRQNISSNYRLMYNDGDDTYAEAFFPTLEEATLAFKYLECCDSFCEFHRGMERVGMEYC